MDKFEQVKGNYYPTFSLRISEETLEQIRYLAIMHKRSINKEMEYALEFYINYNTEK